MLVNVVRDVRTKLTYVEVNSLIAYLFSETTDSTPEMLKFVHHVVSELIDLNKRAADRL